MHELESYAIIIERFYRKMLTHADISKRATATEDWTLTDQLAHLVDSASNNHQRFIRLQIERELEFPGYDAETWRRASKVSAVDYDLLVGLWHGYNLYLLEVIRNVDGAALDHCWITGGERKTLDFLIKDYFRHLEWHEDLFDRTVRDLTSSSCKPR